MSFAQAKLRKACLIDLEKGPKTPSQISTLENEHLSHVSRALRELASRDLVECMTPNSSKNRIYKITERGRLVVDNLKEMEG